MIKIMEYKTVNGDALIDKLLSRSQLDYGDVQEVVENILKNIKANGDIALFEYTKKFDNADINENNVLLSQMEIKEAYNAVPEDIINVIKKATIRIKDFHNMQKRNSFIETKETGEILGQLIRPMDSCGVYVPGGKAAYPSSVLMNIIPAQVAGVKRIVMVTPPNKEGKVNPTTIVAAIEAGVSEIYKIGGAQAIGALAYGTKSIPKVDKIVGPGNIYVAIAKRNVFGYVSIDSVAGPSEILVIADNTANPKFVAADMISQAEHDELACSILITTSVKLGVEVQKELEIQTKELEREDIINKSIDNYGAIIIVDKIDEAIELCNLVAPEHMEICTLNPFELLPKIRHAGAIFLGNYTPEPLGDYMAGPNHVLPTGGTSRFFSPLSVDDFIKKSSIISFTKESIKTIGEDVVKFATAEGLTGHANSVKVRL